MTEIPAYNPNHLEQLRQEPDLIDDLGSLAVSTLVFVPTEVTHRSQINRQPVAVETDHEPTLNSYHNYLGRVALVNPAPNRLSAIERALSTPDSQPSYPQAA